MTKERKLDDPELKKVSGASGTPLSDSDVVPSGDGDAEQLTPAAGEDGCFGSRTGRGWPTGSAPNPVRLSDPG
jgi:hypothetical protein